MPAPPGKRAVVEALLEAQPRKHAAMRIGVKRMSGGNFKRNSLEHGLLLAAVRLADHRDCGPPRRSARRNSDVAAMLSVLHCVSAASFRSPSSWVSSAEATVHPRRRPGARIFEKLPR